MDLLTVFEQHYLPLRLRGKSKETARLHRHSIRQFGKFLARSPSLADLTDASLSRLMHWGRERGLAAPSVNKWRNHLCALWRFAARKGMVKDWPDVEADVEPEKIPKAWLAGELSALFEACRRQKGWIGGVRADLWWVALHFVAYDSSERIGAIRQLTWDNVDLGDGWVTFPADTRKGGQKARMYRIAAETIESLKLIQVPHRKLVFPWDGDQNYLWEKYGTVLKSAGLPADRESKFHRIRRTTASYYEANGGNATELLGHSSRKVTLRYLDPRIVKSPQAIDRLPRPGGTIQPPSEPPNGDAS
jgi:integrase